MGDGGSRKYGASVSESLSLDSIDCAEAIRDRGGAVNSSRGAGDLGLPKPLVSGHSVSKSWRLRFCGDILWTQKEKAIRGMSRCDRESYSTNCVFVSSCPLQSYTIE